MQDKIPMALLKLPVSVARRNSRGDSAARKNAVRASAVENWSTALRGPSAWGARSLFLHNFFYTILTSTGRGDSSVDNIGSPPAPLKIVYYHPELVLFCSY